MAASIVEGIFMARNSPTSSVRRRRVTLLLFTLFGVLFLFFWGPQWSRRRHVRPPVVILEDGPRPTVALTSLGLEADEAYHLGTLSRSEYFSSLESFINITFPSRLWPQLTKSLDDFLNFDSTHPRPEPPSIIWQTNDVPPTDFYPVSWRNLNEGHDYRFLNDDDADDWVRRNFGNSPIEWLWDFMPQAVMKADLLRYLLLLVEGGTYSDVDTTCLKPISRWGFEPDFRGHITEGPPSAIVGIEADVGDRADWHTWWSRPLQIVQWTMRFSPGHPALLDAVRRIYANAIQKEQTMHLRHPHISQSVVNMTLEWTGPAVFTDSMLRFSRLESNLEWLNLRNLKKPLRTGSVTYLPVTGFSPGVGNFGAREKFDRQAMVWHAFKGSWKPKKGKGQ